MSLKCNSNLDKLSHVWSAGAILSNYRITVNLVALKDLKKEFSQQKKQLIAQNKIVFNAKPGDEKNILLACHKLHHPHAPACSMDWKVYPQKRKLLKIITDKQQLKKASARKGKTIVVNVVSKLQSRCTPDFPLQFASSKASKN